ncbi:PEP-CTERM sorting domain-containing protein [Candidatus Nitrospira bockiana]
MGIKRTFNLVAAALALAVLFLGGQPASAAPVIDFGIIAPTVGTIDYSVAGGPLSGLGIDVDNVVGLNTPLNNGVTLPCVGCVLNFVSGPFTGSTATQWLFGAGAPVSVTITGTAGPAAGPLLVGSMQNASVTQVGGTFKIAGALFFDQKHPLLLEFYGLAAGTPFVGGINISFSAVGVPPDTFTSTQIFSGDVVNTAVPEPSALLLLGSGLMGLSFWGRVRRFSAV